MRDRNRYRAAVSRMLRAEKRAFDGIVTHISLSLRPR
jgi:hypothetical protein